MQLRYRQETVDSWFILNGRVFDSSAYLVSTTLAYLIIHRYWRCDFVKFNFDLIIIRSIQNINTRSKHLTVRIQNPKLTSSL